MVNFNIATKINKIIKNWPIQFFFFIILQLAFGCNDDIILNEAADNHSKYLKTIQNSQNKYFNTIYLTSQNDILIAGEDINRQVSVVNFNIYGNKIGEYTLPFDELQHVENPKLYSKRLRNGNYIFSDKYSPQFVITSEDGSTFSRIDYQTYTIDFNHIISPPFLDKNGDIYLSSCFKYYTDFYNYCFIHQFNESGDLMESYKIYDEYFGSNVEGLNVYSVTDNQVFLIGYFYSSTTVKYKTNKVFLATFDKQTRLVKKYIIDENDNTENDFTTLFTTQNNNLTFLISHSNDKASSTIFKPFEINQVDPDFQFIWRKTIDIGQRNVFCNALVALPNNEFLVVGQCQTEESLNNQPFFVRINSNGDPIQIHVFNFPNTCVLNDGILLDANKYIFIGETNSFGIDLNENRTILLKTDLSGDYTP